MSKLTIQFLWAIGIIIGLITFIKCETLIIYADAFINTYDVFALISLLTDAPNLAVEGTEAVAALVNSSFIIDDIFLAVGSVLGYGTFLFILLWLAKWPEKWLFEPRFKWWKTFPIITMWVIVDVFSMYLKFVNIVAVKNNMLTCSILPWT